MAKIGVLTGGGDCPGLNAVIRAVVRASFKESYEVTGIKYGWKGILEKETMMLDLDSVSGILHRGGTILGTSRTNPYEEGATVTRLIANFKEMGLDALVAIGGEDTLGAASKLHEDGLKVVGVPKTIDNDLSGTDYTFGFDTAINIATDCIDRLHTTAESHNRVMVVETMGRHAGWLAAFSGIAGGADMILVPEVRIDLDTVCKVIRKRHARGKTFSIVVVAEGAQFKEGQDVLLEEDKDSFGHVRLGGIGQKLAERIENETGFETRHSVLGHIQRGGSPTAYDRILGTRFGVKAVQMIKDKQFGMMASLQGKDIVSVPLKDAVGTLKTLDMDLYKVAEIFFG